MGGHLHACTDCGKKEFAWHSCNHRSCPLCGRAATAQWVGRELGKRIAAPYFMVTFTLPAELRGLFFGRGDQAEAHAKTAYDLFFKASAQALSEHLAKNKSLRAATSGFTGILHTWSQLLLPHIHIHYIVPGAGLDENGNYVRVKNQNFLLRIEGLSRAFRSHMRSALEKHGYGVDPAVWYKDWGVNIQPFGSGENAIKYLGRYVTRTAIGDYRIIHHDEESGQVTFSWKDRSDHDKIKHETISGVEFVRRYLRHVLPRGMRSIRYFGYCHPAARKKRERIAFHSGMFLDASQSDSTKKQEPEQEPRQRKCPCCQGTMKKLRRLRPSWKSAPRPPPLKPKAATVPAPTLQGTR